MAKNIGPARTITAQDARETFRIEVEVGGTPAVPTYELRGHALIVTRDAAGVVVGRSPGPTTVVVSDRSLTPELRAAIDALLAAIDAVDLQPDAG